jgi:NTE family protein
MLRVLNVVDNQVRSLRKRQVIDAFRAKTRDGMYIGIRSALADYPLPDPIPTDPAVTAKLAAVPTRLASLNADLQEQLINWGYAVCDTGLRAHIAPGSPRGTLPYPSNPLTR